MGELSVEGQVTLRHTRHGELLNDRLKVFPSDPLLFTDDVRRKCGSAIFDKIRTALTDCGVVTLEGLENQRRQCIYEFELTNRIC